MKIRFLHTGDWQLGMTRHFLSEGAQARYSQARFDAIRTLGQFARDEKCQFMLVCGDAFESNYVDRKTVTRAMEALKSVSIPVFILPGNHDPLTAASVYRSSTFIERRPSHVQVIETVDPIRVCDGAEIIGAPWFSKRPVVNPLEEVLANLSPTTDMIRICAAHGGIDLFTPDREAPGVLSADMLERAIKAGKVHFVALGDRHSLTKVGDTERIWYSGTPEATDFSEVKSGYAQVVDVDEYKVDTKAVKIGCWRFVEQSRVDLNSVDDVEALQEWLISVERKELNVVRLKLVGSLPLTAKDILQGHLDIAKDVFGALGVQDDELLVVPSDTDFTNLGFSGFADGTVQLLRCQIANGGEEATVAREALMLMLRLAKETA